MKLWILKAVEGRPEWECWYDKAFAFVVRADSETRAREIASSESGDEGPGVWLNPKVTSCEELSPVGDEGIIVMDYAAA